MVEYIESICKVKQYVHLPGWNNVLKLLIFLLQEIHRNLVDNVNIELYNALHHHMVNKRMLTKDLKNGMTLVSMYNSQKLLINHYPNGVSLLYFSLNVIIQSQTLLFPLFSSTAKKVDYRKFNIYLVSCHWQTSTNLNNYFLLCRPVAKNKVTNIVVFAV